jgi:hypothetical protein
VARMHLALPLAWQLYTLLSNARAV